MNDEQIEWAIAHARLRSQFISDPVQRDPAAIVGALGAVQAQDFAAAKWAIGLRHQDATDAVINDAFNQGRILRTHVLRPTWHFVSADDLSWLLELTGPRVNQTVSSMYRRLGLDDQLFQRSQEIFQRALEGGAHLTRPEMVDTLNRNGIEMNSLDYVHLLMRAELDGVICSGPLAGKQHTYALLQERAPVVRRFDRDQSLAQLAVRYLRSRGPATIKDFAWWSGLTLSDVRRGIDIARDQLISRVVDDVEYWFTVDFEWRGLGSRCVHLLPNYDEYIVGYVDRSAYWHESHAEAEMSRSNPLFNHTIVIDGRIRGTWTRKLKKGQVEVSVNLFEPVDPATDHRLDLEIERYGQFLSLNATRV